jgi:adenylylsulfate kinase
MESRENIHPVFDLILNRQDKESLLKQNAKVIWIVGLSGSGKTTIALGLEKKLNKMGYLTQVLDGDNIRTGINNNLGFTQEDRIENIRRIAEVNKLFLNCGIICINSFISPTQEIRGIARKIIGKDDFIEVFANTPLSVCEKRDIKGLYKKAREGKIKNFTGIDSPFEAPQNAAVEIKTEIMTIEEAVQKVLDVILPKISKS